MQEQNETDWDWVLDTFGPQTQAVYEQLRDAMDQHNGFAVSTVPGSDEVRVSWVGSRDDAAKLVQAYMAFVDHRCGVSHYALLDFMRRMTYTLWNHGIR